jgi:putative Holliday junction resolvase
MSRILGIDYGERRIGLAISDPLGIIALSLPTLDTKKVKDVFEEIKTIVKEKDVEKIVLGLPRNMDGTIGEKGEKVKEFASKLKEKIGKEIDFWDERLTSVESLKTLREEKRKIKREKKIVDQISAVLILQGYLDSQAVK